jgi:hypothetical protein
MTPMKIMRNKLTGAYAFCDRIDSRSSDYVLVSLGSNKAEELETVDMPLDELINWFEKQGFELIGKENHK